MLLSSLVLGPWIIIVGLSIGIKLSSSINDVARVAILVVAVTTVIAIPPVVPAVDVNIAVAWSAKVGTIAG